MNAICKYVKTKKVVSTRKCTAQPMPDDVINIINHLGKEEGVREGIQFLNIDGKATLMDLYPTDEEDDNESNTSDIDYQLSETESVEEHLEYDSDINSYELHDNGIKVENADIVNGNTNKMGDISVNDSDSIVDNTDNRDNSMDANIDTESVINENTTDVDVDNNIDMDIDSNNNEESSSAGQINAEINDDNNNPEENSSRMRYEISSSLDGSYWNNHAIATIIEEREILSANVLS